MTSSNTINSVPIQGIPTSSVPQLPPSKSCSVDYIGTKICSFLDFVPFFSTMTNVIAIFLKVIVGRDKIAAYARKSHYFNHLQQKSMAVCLLLTFPWVGNGLWLIYKLRSTKQTSQQSDFNTGDQPVTHPALPPEIHPADNPFQAQPSNMQQHTPPVVENRPPPASNFDFETVLKKITPEAIFLSAQQEILNNPAYRSDIPAPPDPPTQPDEPYDEKAIRSAVRASANFFVSVQQSILELQEILKHAKKLRIITLCNLGYGPDRAEKGQEVKKAYSEAIKAIFESKKEEIRDYYDQMNTSYEKTISHLTGLYGSLNAYSSYNTLSDYVQEIKKEIESFLNDPNFLTLYLTVAE